MHFQRTSKPLQPTNSSRQFRIRHLCRGPEKLYQRITALTDGGNNVGARRVHPSTSLRVTCERRYPMNDDEIAHWSFQDPPSFWRIRITLSKNLMAIRCKTTQHKKNEAEKQQYPARDRHSLRPWHHHSSFPFLFNTSRAMTIF